MVQYQVQIIDHGFLQGHSLIWIIHKNIKRKKGHLCNNWYIFNRFKMVKIYSDIKISIYFSKYMVTGQEINSFFSIVEETLSGADHY